MNNLPLTNLKYLLVIGLAFSLLGCGATKIPVAGDTGFRIPSRGQPGDDNKDNSEDFRDNDNSVTTQGLLSECNHISAAAFNFEAALATYYDPNNRQFIPDHIQMKVVSIQQQILAAEEQYIKFFRWYQEDGAQRVVNPEAAKFFFVERGSGRFLLEDNPIDRLSKNIINKVIADHDLGRQQINSSNFFNKYLLILTGMDINYDALSTALYDSSTGTAAIGWTDSLLPAFAADPNHYASQHESISLQSIHPLYSRRNSGLSEYQFVAEAEKLCEPFFQ